VSRELRPALAGAAVAAAGWTLGSTTLTLCGLGVIVAGLGAAVWAAAARRVEVVRRVGTSAIVEGDPLEVDLAVRHAALLPGDLRFEEEIGPFRASGIELTRRSATTVVLPALPRGVHRIGPGAVVAVDPLGLLTTAVPGPAGPFLRVRPRVPLLAGTFLDGGLTGSGARRRAVRRLAGSEPHGVREYRDGESLRAVHWPSSARRGRLIVREMEEPPRDEVVVVLDLDESGVVGPPGASSLDEAVRAAAALVRATVAGRRRCGLLLAGSHPQRHSVTSLGGDWEDALDALTAATEVADACTAAVLDRTWDGGVVLVSARPLDLLAESLLRRGAVGVVAIDAATYAGAERSAPDPALLRLAAAGVAVAELRRGDDLAAALSRPLVAARA
jgi:uncharacterized protein (DUF58 family)